MCRLTPLSPEEVADLKLAITEAANDFVDESRPIDDESRLSFSFRLTDDTLLKWISTVHPARCRRASRS